MLKYNFIGEYVKIYILVKNLIVVKKFIFFEAKMFIFYM